MGLPRLIAIVLCALFLPSQVPAADAENGRKLHDAHCIQCHASITEGQPAALYTRPDRMVNDLEALDRQVRWCRDNLDIAWFDEEVADVVAYLNTRFYNFKE